MFVCASQSAAAVNNIALLSSALVSLSAGREAYGPEEAARWLTVSRFSSAILQLPEGWRSSRHHQPGRAAPRGQKFRKLAPTFSYPDNEKKDCSTERQYILPKERYSFR